MYMDVRTHINFIVKGVGEAYEALKKTPYIKPYKFSIFLVLLALPFWIIGMALDREQPNQLADEILLVIGGALHGWRISLLNLSAVVLLKSKWSNCYLLLLPFFVPNSLWCLRLRRFMDFGLLLATLVAAAN